jgi:NAD(P)-dependent dehydrogenase (short-subunit alcohol dehydrogenase family)
MALRELECRTDEGTAPMTNQAFRLDGKVAVVTGAARGIGRAAAVALARAGADVAGIDIVGAASPIDDFAPSTEEDLAQTGREIMAVGKRWLAIQLDQRNLGALRDAAGKVQRALGGTDILFANAGIQAFKPFLEMDDVDWHDQIDINLTGTANALRAFAPAIVQRGAGVSSSAPRPRGSTAPSTVQPTLPRNGALSAS